jgi:hypothetical protein
MDSRFPPHVASRFGGRDSITELLGVATPSRPKWKYRAGARQQTPSHNSPRTKLAGLTYLDGARDPNPRPVGEKETNAKPESSDEVESVFSAEFGGASFLGVLLRESRENFRADFRDLRGLKRIGVVLPVLRVDDASLAVDQEIGGISSDAAITRQHAGRKACAKCADVFAHDGEREHSGPATLDSVSFEYALFGIGHERKGRQLSIRCLQLFSGRVIEHDSGDAERLHFVVFLDEAMHVQIADRAGGKAIELEQDRTAAEGREFDLFSAQSLNSEIRCW